MDYSERVEQIEKKLAALQSELSALKQEMQKEVLEQPYVSKAVAKEKQAEALDTAGEKASGMKPGVQEKTVWKPDLQAETRTQEALDAARTETVDMQEEAAQKPEKRADEAGQEAPAPVAARAETPASAGKENKASTEPLSLEEKIGGKLMGIVAAVLVFIGLILFGTIVYENLGDTAKVALLFAVSAVLLVAGILLHKRKRNWFSLSLTGCGFGALYLSLFMTRVVFGLIATEELYGALLFWFVGIGLFVWKYHSQVVSFLGLLGISMSVWFGVAFLENEGQYVFLILYFFVMSSLYLWIILGRFLPQTKGERYPKLFLATMYFQMVQAVALAARFPWWYGKTGNTVMALLLCLLFSIYTLVLPVLYHMRAHGQLGIPAFFPTGLRNYPRRYPGVKENGQPAENGALWKNAGADESGQPVGSGGLRAVFGWYQVLAGILLALLWFNLLSGKSILGYALFSVFFIGVLAITELLGIAGTEGKFAAIVTAVGLLFAGGKLKPEVLAVFLLVFAVLFLLAGFFTLVQGEKKFRHTGVFADLVQEAKEEFGVGGMQKENAGAGALGGLQSEHGNAKAPDGRRRENESAQVPYCHGKLTEKLISLAFSVLPVWILADFAAGETAFLVLSVCSMGLLALFFVFLLLGKKEENAVLYHQEHADGLKCTCFLLFLAVFGYFCGVLANDLFAPSSDVIPFTVLFVAVTVANGVAFYGRLCKKLYAPECEDGRMITVTFAVNQLLWVFGMILLHTGSLEKYPACFVFLLLATLYLCVSGMKRCYEKYAGRTELGIYLGLRVTVYVLVVLAAFGEIPGFVISCVLILVALGAIIAGFKVKLKSLRLYGLVLAMLAVLKLLMVDISHDNSLETVGCFFIAGILCFCINLVYNKVKKFVEE